MLDRRMKKTIRNLTVCCLAAVGLICASVASNYLSDIYSTEMYLSAAYCDNSEDELVYSEVDSVYDYVGNNWIDGGIPPTQLATMPYVTCGSEPAGAELLITTTEHQTYVEAVPLFVDGELIATTTAAPITTTVQTTAVAAAEKIAAITTTTTTASEVTTAAETTKKPFINSGEIFHYYDDSVYSTMLNLVNAARAEQGLAPLKYSADMHEVAQTRATEIATYYSHQRSNGLGFYTVYAELGLSYRRCGENIAYGLNTFKTPEQVFQAWMDSPSHYKNIMNESYEYVGFGFTVLKSGAKTYYYWSQEFASF